MTVDPIESRHRADLALALTLAGTLSAAAILRFYPPERASFYPRCPIHQYTGLLCPGCGATRALAALTHGSLTQALHANALFVLLLPVLLAWFGMAYLRVRRGAALPAFPRSLAVAMACAAAAFFLVRNLAG